MRTGGGGTGHHIAADAHRFRSWLGGRTLSVGEILEGPRGRHIVIPGIRTEPDADRAVTALYGEHYAALVRLAALLVGDAATAEKIVQDSFVALHGSRRRLQDSDAALCYLRQSVLNRSRSARGCRADSEPMAPPSAADGTVVPGQAPAAPGSSSVVSALRGLPARQREAVVMRYYADLPETAVAEVMGISRRAARQHTERAMAALHTRLEGQTAPGLPRR